MHSKVLKNAFARLALQNSSRVWYLMKNLLLNVGITFYVWRDDARFHGTTRFYFSSVFIETLLLKLVLVIMIVRWSTNVKEGFCLRKKPQRALISNRCQSVGFTSLLDRGFRLTSLIWFRCNSIFYVNSLIFFNFFLIFGAAKKNTIRCFFLSNFGSCVRKCEVRFAIGVV